MISGAHNRQEGMAHSVSRQTKSIGEPGQNFLNGCRCNEPNAILPDILIKLLA